MKTKFTKVAVSERLPKNYGRYLCRIKGYSNFEFYNFVNGEFQTSFEVKEWLEESPDREDEMREMLERIENLKPLIQYPDDTREEHEGEATAINSMLRDLDSLLQSLKQEK